MAAALAAADVAVSRAGASSLAELAARRLPAILIPYPAAANNHQFYNAQAFVQSGAARLLPQAGATAGDLAREILDLLLNPAKRCALQNGLAEWNTPAAAAAIAEQILHWPAPAALSRSAPGPNFKPQKPGMLNV
jgi:UDP-N-acetylglucosamine--N-acetylmuramyl-(pentapeptide) pyrophosphoryl-undecaprenol N-acetylglucosamine transferase